MSEYIYIYVILHSLSQQYCTHDLFNSFSPIESLGQKKGSQLFLLRRKIAVMHLELTKKVGISVIQNPPEICKF